MATTTFAQRLKQTCDDSPHIPEMGKGRQVTLANKIGVSQEAVRKWFTGEAVPRPIKMTELANFLEVDEAWLSLGITPEFDKTEKRKNATVYNGAVHYVAGMVMLEGGNVAFPNDKDSRAGYVDLYAIMRGQQLAVHVCVARDVSEGRYEVVVPHQFLDVRCIALIILGVGKYQLIDMPRELIDEHKIRKAGDYNVMIHKYESKYLTGAHSWPKFKTFGELV